MALIVPTNGRAMTASDPLARPGPEPRAPNPPLDCRHIGILNDYLRVPYATGSTFAAQFLHSEFGRRGHAVTLVGARDPSCPPEELPARRVLLRSLPIRSQPGFHLPFPSPDALRELEAQNFDVLVGQTGSKLMEAGVWLRNRQGVPLVCVNTTMLARLYDALLPEALSRNPTAQRIARFTLATFAEQASVRAFNQSDCLVVLSKGLERYWRERGVRVPIQVIPRPVNPRVAASETGEDPFSPLAKPGGRLLVLCRLVREKGVGRIIDIFARHVAPRSNEVTLTLVGDGADHDAFKRQAARLGVAHRVFFPGEVPVTEVRSWYSHADLFVYASMSETYGQVVSEAMYCGLPVVAFDDEAGVAQQVSSGKDGLLLPPGPDADTADAAFGSEVLALLEQPSRRRWLAEAAARNARARSEPSRVIEAYYAAFERARRHRALCRPDFGFREQARMLTEWTAVHATVAALGLMRPPAILNRYGAEHPRWSESRPVRGAARGKVVSLFGDS